MMKSTFSRLSRQITLFFRRPKVDKVVKVFSAIFKNGFFFLMMFLLYMPIIVIAIQSLNDSMNVNRFEGWTLRWYLEMFEDAELMVAISNTLVTAFLSTLIATVFGTMFAIGIHSLNKKARSRMVFLNQIPILNADVVTGLSLMLIFKVLMNVFPDIFVPFPANALFFGVSITVLLAHVYFSLPYVVLSVLPKLSEIDPNLYDAALDLGSKPFDAVMRVIVPAIKAGIFTGMLMAFTMSIDDFVITFFVTGPGGTTLPLYIYSMIRFGVSPVINALSAVMVAGTVLLVYPMRNFLKVFAAR
jgi:spermidine/putrescine transport system permease protein